MPRERNSNLIFFTKHGLPQRSLTLRTGQTIQEVARGDNVYYWSTEAFTLCSSSGSLMTWKQFKSEAAAEAAARSALFSRSCTRGGAGVYVGQ